MRVNIAKKGNEGWRVCSRFNREGINRGGPFIIKMYSQQYFVVQIGEYIQYAPIGIM
jgi:hypothetical protein